MTKPTAVVLVALLVTAKASAGTLELQHGDHICLIGNTLAERMQHDGWLETLLHSRFPRHELVIRNLGFSGDELTVRLRSRAFGTTGDHLRFHRADVVFAFFGYNESFRRRAGIEPFKKDLDGQTNRVVMQRDMEILDVMTANRDRAVGRRPSSAPIGWTIATRRRSFP